VQGYRADIAFDGEHELPEGVLVLVEQGVIVGIESGRADAPLDCPVAYQLGTTLLPGLIDAHTHLCGNSGPDALDRLPNLTDDEIDVAVGAALRAHLAAGVTAVRDLGDQNWAVVDRHRDRPDGPTVIASGPPITSIGGHCAAMGGAVRGVDALRRAVRDRADRGADLVKIMTSGGTMTTTTDVLACQFTGDEVAAVVDEAHRLGLPVAAHAHALAAVEQSVVAGVDTIEHCTCMAIDGVRTPPELADAIIAAGIVVCPTLGYDLSALGGELPTQVKAMMAKTGLTLEERDAHIAELYRRGVTMISGDDSGINPGKPHGVLPNSIARLVELGASPVAALASATAVAAKACGLASRTGRLAVGLDADLLIVDGDPTIDIAALRRVNTVVSRGRVVPADE
jgi:imidazolonepropionase-like amidohydrolase